MTDAKDAVREARAENLRLAASRVARKQELAGEVTVLELQRAEAAEIAATAGDDVRVQAESILRELDERLRAKRSELDTVEQELRAVQDELKELERLGESADRAEVDTLVASGVDRGDPLIRSLEEVALDNARGHIADMEAQVRLGEELAPDAPADKPSGKLSDEDARRAFEELRAKAGKGPAKPQGR